MHYVAFQSMEDEVFLYQTKQKFKKPETNPISSILGKRKFLCYLKELFNDAFF